MAGVNKVVATPAPLSIAAEVREMQFEEAQG
jgi:hypothetical protein